MPQELSIQPSHTISKNRFKVWQFWWMRQKSIFTVWSTMSAQVSLLFVLILLFINRKDDMYIQNVSKTCCCVMSENNALLDPSILMHQTTTHISTNSLHLFTHSRTLTIALLQSAIVFSIPHSLSINLPPSFQTSTSKQQILCHFLPPLCPRCNCDSINPSSAKTDKLAYQVLIKRRKTRAQNWGCINKLEPLYIRPGCRAALLSDLWGQRVP